VTQINKKKLSIIIPACNEAQGLNLMLPRLKALYPDAELMVVNDGSTDGTEAVCHENNIQLLNRPVQMGNGAAVKAGARAATGDVLVFMDADGQHQPEDIALLLQQLDNGYDMAVGSRQNSAHASISRLGANKIYNKLASWITSQKIPDLTSGFRAVDASKFREFLHLLPNGFSYPTTITMAFFRAGYSVAYMAVNVKSRIGNSHIQPLRDGLRFLLIIFKIGTLYSPLKFFAPISFLIFSTGLGYYLYVYFTQGRFTNMSALLFTTAILVFFIGIVSEQLTMLFYRDKD
jgi:glycosyltransferase involved in cell wall biosynthesis